MKRVTELRPLDRLEEQIMRISLLKNNYIRIKDFIEGFWKPTDIPNTESEANSLGYDSGFRSTTTQKGEKSTEKDHLISLYAKLL